MKDRRPPEGAPERATDPTAAAPAPAAPDRLDAGGVLALQRTAGNAAVARLLRPSTLGLQRQHEDAHDGGVATAVPRQGAGVEQAAGGAAATPPSPAVAAVQAEAAETVTRLRRVQQEMLTSTNVTVRNTAQLFAGASPRLRFTPMTLRSDSEQIRAARGEAPGTRAYYFVGTTQPPLGANPASPPPGTLRFGPNTMGTIDGNTIVVRGKDQSGGWRPDDDIKGVFVHETSHILVSSYGQHPNTDVSAASFDRYKDEFRAYFVEQFGPYAALEPDVRARAIKRHLVGTSVTDTRGYEPLRTAYWTGHPNAFSRQVDAHTRPDGFNLTNSPRLDRLLTALGEAAADPGKLGEAVVAVARLDGHEREEARSSPLIRQRALALGPEGNERVRAALDAPTRDDYTGQLNASKSPRIAQLYEQLALNADDDIKAAYSRLSSEERAELQMNPAMMVFVDHHVLEPRQRACVYAMLVGRSATQFDAMHDFLEACFLEFITTTVGTDPTGGQPSAPSENLRSALRRVGFTGRLALYRLVEDARRRYVDVLPDAIKRPLLLALRGDRDP